MICLLTSLFSILKSNYDVSTSKETNKANMDTHKKTNRDNASFIK